ncbi:MAG: hypothetical protein ACU0A6_01010 [Shimia sp.]|jgi:hypothetical protein|uniref:hypothetical protein n=1 Tax=Shimia sp. TaxID=1954381 RepID=UPI0040585C8C
MTEDLLQSQLLAAHAAGDRKALVNLYVQAANGASSEVARGFFLTHAYVFALESGDPTAHDLHRQLVALGRD